MLLPYAPTGSLGQLRRRHAASGRSPRIWPASGSIRSTLDAEIRDLDLPRAPEDRDRPRRLPPAAHPAARRADLDPVRPRRRLARRADRSACARDGITVVFISHRLREVRAFCDRLTVLRNGRHIGTAEVDAIGDDEVIRMIIGRSIGRHLSAAAGARPLASRRRAGAGGARARDRRQARRTPASLCGRARSSASPACRAWASRTCSSPASA